jgi:predicted dinucleotide-binding enzyme
MRIAILGTGRVAQTLAAGLLRADHDVVIGSRDPANRSGLPAPVVTSADAVVGADVVLDAVQGVDTIPLLESIGPDNLDGTVLWDIANAANPDFSLAIPDDSLGRRIQEAFPGVKVVKAANNVAAAVVADPSTLPAPTTLFLSGDDTGAKEVVSGLLIDLGWPPESLFDLGGIANAYGQEHFLALFGTILHKLGTPYFNIAIVTAA